MRRPILALTLMLSVAATAPAQNAVVPRLHVVLLADGRDPALTPYWKANRAHLAKILEEGLANRPHRINLSVLDDAKISAASLTQRWQDKIKPDDTLLVYYAGRSEITDQGRRLFPGKTGQVDVPVLKTSLAALKPRQLVIVTDSLQAAEARLEPVTTAALGDNLVSLPLKASWPVVDALFFHHRGVTEIHAVQADARWLLTEAGKKPQGSLFSLTLIPLLCQKAEYFGAKSEMISWQEFSGFLSRETEKLAVAKTKKLGELYKDEPLPEGRPNFRVVAKAESAPQKILEKTWLFGAEFTDARLNGEPVAMLLKVYPKTPAAEAGLQDRDLILAVDATKIVHRDSLVRAIENSEGEIEVLFRREGTNQKMKVKLRPVRPKLP